MVTAVEDLIHNLEALNVEIIMAKEADSDLIQEMAPDALVIATGAKPIAPPIPGIESDKVIQAWDLLAGKACSGKKVVVVGGNAVGLETALFLADQFDAGAEAVDIQ